MKEVRSFVRGLHSDVSDFAILSGLDVDDSDRSSSFHELHFEVSTITKSSTRTFRFSAFHFFRGINEAWKYTDFSWLEPMTARLHCTSFHIWAIKPSGSMELLQEEYASKFPWQINGHLSKNVNPCSLHMLCLGSVIYSLAVICYLFCGIKRHAFKLVSKTSVIWPWLIDENETVPRSEWKL